MFGLFKGQLSNMLAINKGCEKLCCLMVMSLETTARLAAVGMCCLAWPRRFLLGVVGMLPSGRSGQVGVRVVSNHTKAWHSLFPGLKGVQ